jgi:hypothetical protein
MQNLNTSPSLLVVGSLHFTLYTSDLVFGGGAISPPRMGRGQGRGCQCRGWDHSPSFLGEGVRGWGSAPQHFPLPLGRRVLTLHTLHFGLDLRGWGLAKIYNYFIVIL